MDSRPRSRRPLRHVKRPRNAVAPTPAPLPHRSGQTAHMRGLEAVEVAMYRDCPELAAARWKAGEFTLQEHHSGTPMLSSAGRYRQ